MPSHGSVAKSIRLNKEKHPEYYCPVDRCLWRTYDARTGISTPCGNHHKLPVNAPNPHGTE